MEETTSNRRRCLLGVGRSKPVGPRRRLTAQGKTGQVSTRLWAGLYAHVGSDSPLAQTLRLLALLRSRAILVPTSSHLKLRRL